MAEPSSLVVNASVENYLREQVDFSPVTKSKRLTFLKFVESDKLHKPLALATREDIIGLADLMVNGVWSVRKRKGGGVREVRLRNRSPRVYLLALKAYFDWVGATFPGVESPMRGFKIPRGKPEPEKPTIRTRDLDRLLRTFDHKWELVFYHVLLIAGHHVMRAHEILPYRMDELKTICDCKGECDRLHDFRIRERPYQIMFRVKGMPREVRFSDWEESSLQEILWLREVVKDPPCTADTGTKWLTDRARELNIKLVDASGKEVPDANLGFHILARHTLITKLVEAKQHPAVVNKAAHWSPNSRMWARYAHPDTTTVEAAKAQAFPKLLGGDRKRQPPQPPEQ